MALVIEKSKKIKIDITLKEKWLDKEYIKKHFGKNASAYLIKKNKKFCIFKVLINEKIEEDL